MPANVSISDKIYSSGPHIVAHRSARKLLFQFISANVDRWNKAVGDSTIAHVHDQRINRRLPFRLRHTNGNFIVCNDARITLRKRDEYQNSATTFFTRDATANELIHCNAMSDSAARLPRHERNPNGGQTEEHQKH